VTANGSAEAGSDYDPISDSVIILAGETSTTVSVPVHGGHGLRADEAFSLILTGATGATIADNEGVATILNDDAPPPPAGGAFINEIHYDNAGTDAGETIEIAAAAAPTSPAGSSSSTWQQRSRRSGHLQYSQSERNRPRPG
jgi:hypothetical protein